MGPGIRRLLTCRQAPVQQFMERKNKTPTSAQAHAGKAGMKPRSGGRN
jgi:hypothetical protein